MSDTKQTKSTMKTVQKWIPNLLSLWRLGSAGKLAILLAVPNHPLWVAQLLIVVGILTDKLDGTLARRWKVESELGKRIESIADPFFVFFSALYAYKALDYPGVLFFSFFIVGLVTTGARLLAGMVTGKMFYEKSQITRIATATAMLTVFIYIFQIPYREWVIWPAFVYGMFAALNYMRMIVVFLYSERTQFQQNMAKTDTEHTE